MITYGSTTLTSYNTITKIEVYYYKSTSATSLSGGSWSTTKPTWESGKYIWQKIRTTYEGKLDNGQTFSESDPVNITGQQGQQGETGASAYSYKLNVSDTIISVSKNGTYSTNSVTFSATSKQGNEDINPYEGRFKIETTMDGITWTTQYTSSANESSKTFTIPSDISNIRCSLYQAGGTTVLLDITSVSIVRDGIDGALYPNLSPFFSHDLTDVYNAETNPNGYWIEYSSYGWTKNSNFTFTQLEDGWLHVHIDNSSGTSLIRNDCCMSKYNPSIKKGTMYTFLTEFRNNQSTGLDATSNFYLVQQSGGRSVQFWGINTTTAPSVKLEGIGGLSIRVIDIPSDGSYAIARGTKYSEPDGDSSHWTTEDMMVSFTFRANAGAVIDYDIRLSMYEGEYWGNYVPYIISDVTDIRNSAEMANNKIDNLEIGGRNLLRTEPQKYIPTDYSAYEFTLTEPLEINQTYTIQLWNVDVSHSAKTEDQLGINVYYCGGSVTFGKFIGTDYFTNGHADHLTLVFTPTEGNITHSNVVNVATKFIRLYNSYPSVDGVRNMSVEKWKLEKGNKATDWSPAPEDVEDSIKAYTESIQSQVDGMAEIHYGTVVPTLSNAPYTSWGDTATRDMHVDDLYYNTSTGYCYRFIKSGSTYSWTRIKDSDITAAATAASNANTAAGNAQTTADNANTLAGQKRRIFVAQPTPPYEVGDLWVEGSNGDIKKCKTARATGSYTASDWELASKYTDDTTANTANMKVDNLKKVRLGWKVNYSDYSTPNNGECIFHGYDSNNVVAHVDGIVEWNGADLTITKGMWINPNKVAPFNTPILHIYRTDIAPHHADVWWDDTQKKWRGYMYKENHTPDVAADATSAAQDWIWNEITDCILATYVSSGSETEITSAQLFNPPKKFSELPDPSLAQNLIDNLEIGSRNLLKGTASPNFVTTSAVYDSNWRGMSGGNGTFSIVEIDDSPVSNVNKTFRVMNNTTGNRDFVQFVKDFNINWGGQWVFSCYARGINGSVKALIRSWNSTDNNAALQYSQTIPETVWTKIIIKIPEDMQWNSTADSTDNLDFRFGISGAGSIEYIAPKLERGNKATDWSPAPEDTQADIDIALAQSVEYIVGTQTASTGTWTGTTTDNELKIGKTIAYKLPYAGSGNASLVLTLANGSTTDAIPVYLNTTRVTTHFGANSVINMTYDGQYWRASSIPNTNNYDRRQHSNAITAKTAITAKHLIVGDSTGYQQITSTSGGTLEFDLGYPILWAYSDIAATKTSTATYEAYPSVNFSTSGTIQNGATNKMLWLKGTIRGNIFTLASTNFLTTRIPTSDDGMYYIPLGIMSSATAGYFSSSNRIYAYIDEEFQPLDNAAALTAIKARSEIVQTQQTLSLQIRDISVGGANLFERTKTFEGTANQSTAHDSFTEFVYKDLTVKSANTVTFGNKVVELSAYQYTDLTSNMWYSFSFYAKGNVDIGFMYAGTGNAVIDSIDVSWDDNTYTGFNTTSTSSNIIWLTPTNNWQRYSVVFHIEEQDITALHRLIGLYARPVSSYTELSTENKDILITETGTDVHLIMEGNEVQICGYKLELGNKPTDWTPADNDKATYDNIISQINLSKEGIAIRADKIRLEGMITANEGFSIDEYGNMTANNGKFNGLFESYATEINENTFDIKISNGHIHLLNNEDRTLSDNERHVGYIGGGRNKVTYVDGTNKNNDAIDIRLDNGNDFMISAHKDWGNSILYRITNHLSGGFSADYWCNLHMYDGNRIQMYGYKDNQNPQIEFYRYSKNTSGYLFRGLLSLHSVTDNNSEFSDRLYLWAKNQGNDLVGDQWLHFTGKGLKYTSGNQPLRTGYVATDKYIVTQYFSLPDLTIAKNTSQNFTIDVSRDGYTPIMCIPKVGGGQNAFYLSIYTWSMSGNIVTIRTHNNSSTSDVSNVTISLQVLYKLTY